LAGGAAGLVAAAGAALTSDQPAFAQTTVSITDWINAVASFGADPTGVQDSTAAINNALTAATNQSTGGVVYLPTGSYRTSGPLIVGARTLLLGAIPAGASMNSASAPDYSGTVIKPSVSWSGAGLNQPGVIHVNGAVTVVHKPGISNLWIDGTDAPAGVHGISAFGGAFHGVVLGVGVFNVPQDGMRFTANGNARADGWTVGNCVVQTFGRYGVFWHGQDSQFTNVHVQAAQASTSGGSCWYVENGNNCRWLGCRGDQSADSGWTIDSNPGGTGGTNSPGSSITLIGCGTENNASFGLHLINSAGGGQMRTPVLAVGCSWDFDGGRTPPAGTGAGVCVAGYNTLNLIGCDVTTADNAYPEAALATAAVSGHAPALVRAVGGIWNCNGPTLVQDAAGMGTAGGLHIDVHAVTGGPWLTSSTISPYQNGIATTPPAVTTPAVPASGAKVANQTGCDVAVYLSGGTVSRITVGGTAVLRAAPATVYLPAGATIALAYSTAPTWVWQAV
jgi:hypothetical protein